MKLFKFLLLSFLTITFTTGLMAQKSKEKQKTVTTASYYQCPMKCEGEKLYDESGKCPVCNMNLKAVKKDEVVHHCPMKCEGEKSYAKAGKCPVCSMKLKAKAKTKAPKAKDDHSGHHH